MDATQTHAPNAEPAHFAVDLVRPFPMLDGRLIVPAGPSIVAVEIADAIPADLHRQPMHPAEA